MLGLQNQGSSEQKDGDLDQMGMEINAEFRWLGNYRGTLKGLHFAEHGQRRLMPMGFGIPLSISFS